MTAESRLLMEEIRRVGLDARPLVWDDPSVDWALQKVCVIRETWDYHHRRDEFVAWAEQVGTVTTLLNPAEVVRWNTHKGYLRELEARGVPVVPTIWLHAGDSANLAETMSTNGWNEVVVKPAVSASAFETIQVTGEQIERGQAHIDRLLPSRDLMVQPFMAAVRDYGERSLIFIDGELTHAVRRLPALHLEEGSTAWDAALMQPTPDEVNLAELALRAAGFPTLYARVDMVPDEANKMRLMELELVEPSLFLMQAPHAARRLARAIVSRAEE
jgi:glutathione synthase/RimK-type ligase-like ATP-grasp enzyme